MLFNKELVSKLNNFRSFNYKYSDVEIDDFALKYEST